MRVEEAFYIIVLLITAENILTFSLLKRFVFKIKKIK